MTDSGAPTTLATKVETVRGWLTAQTPELAKVLPQGMAAERFARIALTQVLRNPALAECDKASFILAIMESAQLGLEPDSVSGLSYLVPFKGKVTLIPGYQGLIQLAHRHPKVKDIAADVICEQDSFSHAQGTHPHLTHVPPLQGPRGAILGAYAVARLRGGGFTMAVMSKDEIEAHRTRSRAGASGPWSTDYPAMCKKTAVRQLCKFIPKSPALMQALAVESDPEEERPIGSPYVPPGKSVEEICDAIAGTSPSEANAPA
jgi:recombination protein RecT